MKIFALQSKLALIMWGMVIGLAVGVSTNKVMSYSLCNRAGAEPSMELTFNQYACNVGLRAYGFPLISHELSSSGPTDPELAQRNFTNEVLNIVFWILVSSLILIFIRYFRNRSRKLPF